jgi:orotate phosphoribosyltransferase
LADKLKKPMVYIRSEKKGHGAGKRIEGDTEGLKEKKVVIVEDLISTGGSSLSAVEAVEEEMESEVTGVLAIFEYGFEMAKERFKDEGVDYTTLTNFEALVALMQSRGEFEQDDVMKTMQFSNSSLQYSFRSGT